MARSSNVTVDQRFWAKVDTTAGPDACWPWTGAYNTPAKRPWKGTRRPIFKVVRRGDFQLVVYATRYMLALHDGVALDQRTGLEACHLVDCSNPKCVNPRHLYWGTPVQNRKDRYGARPR